MTQTRWPFAVALRGGPAPRLSDRFEQPVEDAERQSLAGLAVGAFREGPAAERDDVSTDGVAVEDLEEEQVDGDDQVEEAVPPGVALLAAGGLEGGGLQEGGLVLSEPLEDGHDAGWHGGLLP